MVHLFGIAASEHSIYRRHGNDDILDIGPYFSNMRINLAHSRGRIPDAILIAERVRCPRAGFANRSRAASGIMLSGITTGVWGAATGLGQESAGNAREDRVPGSLA